MGIMGVAPSLDMLNRIRAREDDVADRGGYALPPDPAGAIPADGDIAETGLRTIPPRENGGNVDIKQLVAGTTVLVPVFVDGALFSTGDGHFAQGDGEVCGTAIEADATLHARFGLRKGAAVSLRGGLRFEQAERSQHIGGPAYATTGIPVDRDGVGHSENLTLAAQNATLAMIDYLEAEYGYTRQQAYTIWQRRRGSAGERGGRHTQLRGDRRAPPGRPGRRLAGELRRGRCAELLLDG